MFVVAFALPFVRGFVSNRLPRLLDRRSTPEMLADAGPATARSRRLAVEISIATAIPEGAPAADGSLITGKLDVESDSGVMDADLGSLGGAAPGRRVAAVKIGPLLFLRTPRLGEMVPGSKPWLVLDAAGLAPGQGGTDLDALESLDATGEISDAVFLAVYFFGSTKEVLRGDVGKLIERATKVGPERIRGASTTHYELALKQDLLGDQLIDELREGFTGASADVWVDDEHRIRRYRLNVRGQADAGGAMGGSTHEFFDLGARFRVDRPPGAEAASPRELLDAYARGHP